MINVILAFISEQLLVFLHDINQSVSCECSKYVPLTMHIDDRDLNPASVSADRSRTYS